MNLITFNIDDKLIKNVDQTVINKKKNLLFSYACQHNKNFQNKDKYKIANIYNFNNKKLLSENLKFLEKTYDEILIYLKNSLNKAHNKNFEKDYWEILVGKWLKTFINQTYSNWKILRRISYINYTCASLIRKIMNQSFQ